MKKIIVANWKMNPETLKEAKSLFDSVLRETKKIKDAEVIICLPFVYLESLKAKSDIKLGAQNCFWKNSGAFTGEISPSMLKNSGIKYVIIGHSERRHYLSETDEAINRKMKAALDINLIPILCVGETKEQRNSGKTEEVIASQLEKGLQGVSMKKFILAYEPVWAIGTGNPCRPDDAQKILLFVRTKIPQEIPVLYGGSVNSQNARDYLKKADFQGLLVGGASLNAQDFAKIVKNAEA